MSPHGPNADGREGLLWTILIVGANAGDLNGIILTATQGRRFLKSTPYHPLQLFRYEPPRQFEERE